MSYKSSVKVVSENKAFEKQKMEVINLLKKSKMPKGKKKLLMEVIDFVSSLGDELDESSKKTNDELENFDPILAFINSIGINRELRDIIDKIYKEHEERYYKSYCTSRYFNFSAKEKYTLKTEESINKLIGIVDYCMSNKNFLPLERIIKSKYKHTYNYAKNTHTIDLDFYTTKYLMKVDELKGKDKSMIVSELTILAFLAGLFGKTLKGNNSINLIVSFLKNSELDAYETFDKSEINDETMFTISNILRLLGFKQYEGESTLALYLDNCIEEATLKKMGLDGYEGLIDTEACNQYSTEDFSIARDKILNSGAIKYKQVLSLIYSCEGLDINELMMDTPVNEDVLSKIIYVSMSLVKMDLMPSNETPNFVMTYLMLYNIIYQYKEAKKLYLEDATAEKFNQLNDQHKEIDTILKKIDFYESKFEDLKTQNQVLKGEVDSVQKNHKAQIKAFNKKISAQESKIISLEKERDGYIDTVEKQSAQIKELESIINKMSSQSTEVALSIEPEVDVSDMLETLLDKKIIIIGGHTHWKKKLLSYLPNAIVYTNDDINKDFNILRNKKMVFYNVNAMSHGVQYKANNFITDNTTIKFLDAKTKNINTTISQIYNAFID